MEALNLTETEREFFGELFANIDVDSLGKIPYVRGLDFINSCQLPADVVEKIIETCGAKRLGHFGRSQFYIAMKLVASAQGSMPVKGDGFVMSKSAISPLFISGISDNKSKQPIKQQSAIPNSLNNSIQSLESCQLPPPPTKSTRTRHSTIKNDKIMVSPLHGKQPNKLGGLIDKESKENSSDSSTSPELVHSPKLVAPASGDRSWIKLEAKSENLDWSYAEEGHHLLCNDEESEQGLSSNEEDDSADIWTISNVQRRYYIQQFDSLQRDPSGKLAGSVAKEFFEKSKLAQTELSKIWKLSDIDKDGALTSEEFCTAMHLVVLKRNNVDIPDVLPASLVSTPGLISGSNSARYENIPESSTLSPQSKQWTKFTDSPTQNLITISSPQQSLNVEINQPANFDFNAMSIETDPKILHPVALRVSPDGQVVHYTCDIMPPSQKSQHVPDMNAKLSTSPADVAVVNRTELFQKPAPPPPPPRPRNLHGHTRSSSLDLNKLDSLGTKTSFTPSLSNTTGVAYISSAQHKGAFTAYKKPEQKCAQTRTVMDQLRQKYILPAPVIVFKEERDTERLLQTVHQLQERNLQLEDVCKRLIHDMAQLIESQQRRTAANI